MSEEVTIIITIAILFLLLYFAAFPCFYLYIATKMNKRVYKDVFTIIMSLFSLIAYIIYCHNGNCMNSFFEISLISNFLGIGPSFLYIGEQCQSKIIKRIGISVIIFFVFECLLRICGDYSFANVVSIEGANDSYLYYRYNNEVKSGCLYFLTGVNVLCLIIYSFYKIWKNKKNIKRYFRTSSILILCIGLLYVIANIIGINVNYHPQYIAVHNLASNQIEQRSYNYYSSHYKRSSTPLQIEECVKLASTVPLPCEYVDKSLIGEIRFGMSEYQTDCKMGDLLKSIEIDEKWVLFNRNTYINSIDCYFENGLRALKFSLTTKENSFDDNCIEDDSSSQESVPQSTPLQQILGSKYRIIDINFKERAYYDGINKVVVFDSIDYSIIFVDNNYVFYELKRNEVNEIENYKRKEQEKNDSIKRVQEEMLEIQRQVMETKEKREREDSLIESSTNILK